MSESESRSADGENSEDKREGSVRALRIVEALLFASAEPLSEKEIARHLPRKDPHKERCAELLETLREDYRSRGVNLARIGEKWMFRTAADLSYLLRREERRSRRLSSAALETLAIIAYHQPVTRAEIEDIRGKGASPGTLDILMEAGWVRVSGRRAVPGRPVTYGVSEAFLAHFGLESLSDLPGLEELKAAGLMSSRPPQKEEEEQEEGEGEEEEKEEDPAPSSER